MRAGSVVSIRVNPRDSMAVVDLMKQSGLLTQGMSFAQMVSIALSGCLEELRKSKAIPTREGYEYADVCGPYVMNVRNGRKLAITEQIHKIGSEFKVDLALPIREQKASITEPNASPDTPQMKEIKRLFVELNNKKELAETGIEGVYWSASDQAEWKKYHDLIFHY